ncbi:MAG: hypothetical protein IPJ28_01305 [Betaproteobacteria bacterium]|nr:hypothetical protein [Betaproteobacteria bacterium]
MKMMRRTISHDLFISEIHSRHMTILSSRGPSVSATGFMALHHDLITLNLGLAMEREALEQGELFKWLRSELHFERVKGAIWFYSSHPVTEKMIQALLSHRTTGAKYELPHNFVPVHFIGAHAQTAIRIPSLTYDRIKTFLQKQSIEKRRVVLLDDASVTGKVQRELEQLLRNAGARAVTHLAIVTRTGCRYTEDTFRSST